MAFKHFITILFIGFLLLSVEMYGSTSAFLKQPDRQDEQILFDVAGWNAPMVDTEGIFTGTRLNMVDDLLKRYDFHDWDLESVKALLGTPDDTRYRNGKYVIEYDLREGLNLLIFEVDSQQEIIDYFVQKP